jgi:glycosyltransferase involved in cell wall biosynthesis
MNSRELIFISTARGLGGGEHFTIELLRELQGRGWSIALVCPADAPLFSEDSLRGLDVRAGIDLSAKIRQPLRMVGALFRWIRFVRRRRTTLIYGNGLETLKWMAVAKKIRRTIAVCHLHDSFFGYYDAPRTRVLSRTVDRFFAISETVRAAFHSGSGVSLDRIALIPNGVPLSAEPEIESDGVRAELGLSESAPLVVMVARTDALKGHDTLLRAIPAVLARHPSACFVFVGIEERSAQEKKLVAEWRRRVEESGIGRAVRFEPYRPDARRFMREADLVVVPSFAEGFGRTAIEAMAEGTAVIASAVGGLAEIIVSGTNGLLVPAGDVAALASALTRLLDDPELRRQLERNGRKSVEELYSTKTMADRIEQELLRLGDPGEESRRSRPG